LDVGGGWAYPLAVPILAPITDPADPRLEPFRSVRERDLKRDDGLFVVEGEVVLRAMLAAGRFKPVALFLSETRARALADVIAALPPDGAVHVATPDVMAEVVGFPLHRGVLALAPRPAPEPLRDALARLPARALVLVCVGIANHDNAGALMRNAAAFGVDLVAFDETCCDPLYRKAIRVSVGAALRVPFHHGGTAGDVLRQLHDSGFERLALSPRADSTFPDLAPGPRVALIVGAEGPGLTADILAVARPVRIPMAAGFDSLNVATAAAIGLHELTRPSHVAAKDVSERP
jgi:tRNA G18 (ribose-2'-O)-methylase SpoU